MKRNVVVLALVLGAMGLSQATGAPYRDEAGPHTVATRLESWQDKSRDRDLPVKWYYPFDVRGVSLPLIVFSHGLGGTREGGRAWGRHWASYGYVCLHLQHRGSDASVWQKGSDFMANMRAAANAGNWILRAQDVRFALDAVARLRKTHPAKAILDLESIGMCGHSFGAETTIAVCGKATGLPRRRGVTLADPRIDAGIAFSPPGPPANRYGARVYGGIALPFYVLTGTRDRSPIRDTTPAEREAVYHHLPADGKYLAVFDEGDHMVFSGRPRRRGKGDHDAAIHRLIRMSSTAFWDAYLKKDPRALRWLRTECAKEMGATGSRFERK